MKVIAEIRKRLRPLKRAFRWLWRVLVVVPYVRLNIWRNLRKMKQRQRPIRVLFLLHELSKWKLQCVFDLMRQSSCFEPILGLTFADLDWGLSLDEKKAKHEKMKQHFQRLGISCIETYSFDDNDVIGISRFSPDVVFYQQPWGYRLGQHPAVVSRYALTCYVPYFVPNFGYLPMDALPLFHSSLFRYYTLNKQWAEMLAMAQRRCERSTAYLGTGHPIMDVYSNHGDEDGANGYVIYAPHWSVCHPRNINSENYSTFLVTGQRILEFALSHPEVKWAFKPHPSLRQTLLDREIWSKEKIDEYYSAWEKIGVACYTGDYQAIFWQSRLLITDCASFLCEYAATKKPIIRLVSSCLSFQPCQVIAPLLETYYNVHSFDELERTLDDVLLQGNDYKKELRINAVKGYGLLESHAAKNIVADFMQFCGRTVAAGGDKSGEGMV